MKKIIKLITIIIIYINSIGVQAQTIADKSNEKNNSIIYAANVDWVKQVSKKYSPDSWNLLEEYENLPLKQEAKAENGAIIWAQKPVKTYHYLKGKSKTDLLLSMSTNVHEISHAFFRHNSFRYANEKGIKMNWDNAEGFIYLSPSNSYFISVPRKILFPSGKLSSVIPKKMVSFRYDIYIEGNTSTQSEGIIGLLNEFHAYYLGSKYTYQMLEAYKMSEGKAKGFYYWVSHLQSIMSAFYEFDYFIKEYLLFMKSKHPSNYEQLRDDKSFYKAYSSVMSLYSNLIDDYFKTINHQVKILNESGTAEISMEEDILWVWQKGSKTKRGTSYFSEDKAKLETLLKSDRYKTVEKDFHLK